jgi:hypothetical protein
VTPQEEQLLQSLAERVNSTQLQEKDPDAEAFLNQSFNPNPDALYILAQTVLVQNIALEQARGQVAQLQQQLQQARQPAHASSFLGNLLGHRDPQPAPPASVAVQPAYAQTSYQQQGPPFQPVQQVAQPQYDPQYQPQYQPVAQPGYVPVGMGQPSFLRGAVQTAAGVAAGALAFEGVEAALHGIMGHPGFGGGYGLGGPGVGMGGFGMGGEFNRPVEETVINNNYYDQPGGAQGHHEQLNQSGLDQSNFDQGGLDRGSGEQHFRDTSSQGGAQFTDASYNTQGDDRGSDDRGNDDRGNTDNSNFDNSGQDLAQDDNSGFADSSYQDSGGFDDGGGGFDGGGDSSSV